MSLDRIIDTGSYVGNGTTQSITVGWQACLVVVVSARSGGPATGRALSFKTSDMPTDLAWACDIDSKYDSGMVTLTSTGFTVGAEARVNHSGSTFYWMAIRDRFALDCGQYVGDTAPTKTITLNRQPAALFQFLIDPLTNPYDCWWKTTTMGTSFAVRYRLDLSWLEFIVTLISTGFTAGSATNQNLATYAYVALYNVVGSTQHFETGSYTGAGTGQTITLGYQPRFVFIWEGGATGSAAFKFDNMSATSAGVLDTTYTYESGLVSIGATGFTLPAGSAVDENGVAYHWLAGRY